jgi:hypothetical protein
MSYTHAGDLPERLPVGNDDVKQCEVKGRNYETVGPKNSGRSTLCRRASSIRLFASVCERLAPVPGNMTKFVGQTLDDVRRKVLERSCPSIIAES